MWADFTPPADIPTDQLWNPEEVKGRLLEAAIVIEKTGGRVFPKGYGSSMPEYAYDWGDRLAQQQQEEEDKKAGERARNRSTIGATNEMMTRVEQAMRWPIEYLAKYDEVRMLLMLFLRCRAKRKNFAKEARKKGVARMTAFRYRDRALTAIAIGLIRSRVPLVRAAGLDRDEPED